MSMFRRSSAGHLEAFVYFISQRTPFPGVADWLTANRERVTAFLAWSRGYAWAAPTRRGLAPR
jgi:hypothetical protein